MRRARHVAPGPVRIHREHSVPVRTRHVRLHRKRVGAVRIGRRQLSARREHHVGLGQARRRGARDHRPIVRAGERHRYHLLRAISRRHRHAVRVELPIDELIMRRAGRVAPGPGRIHREYPIAVRTRHVRLHHERVGAIHIGRHQAARRCQRLVRLGQERRRHPRDYRRIVAASYRHRHHSRRAIGRRHRDAVGVELPRNELVMRRGGRVRPRPARIHREHPVAVRPRHVRLHHKRVGAIHVGRDQAARRCQHRIRLGQARRRHPRNHRRIVGACYRHGHQLLRAIGRCHREAVRVVLPRGELVMRRHGAVAPGPARIHREHAVAIRARHVGLHHKRVGAVHVGRAQATRRCQHRIRLDQARRRHPRDHRRIVGTRDRHRHRGSTLRTSAVLQRVGEGIGCTLARIQGLEYFARVVHDIAINDRNGSPRCTAGYENQSLGIARIHVGVVGQQAGSTDAKRRIFVRRYPVRICHRRIVDRRHREVDGGHVGIEFTVVDLVGEAIGTVVVGIRRVGEAAVNANAHPPVLRAGDDGRRQLRAFHIARLGEQVNCDSCVFRRRIAQRLHHRRVVHRRDADADAGGVGVDRAVAELVGEAVLAVVVRLGQVAEAAVGVERHRAVHGAGDDCRDEAGLVGVEVVGERGDGERRVLVGGDGVVVRLGDTDADVAHGDLAGGCAEADQVEAQVDGGAGRDAGEVDAVGAAAVGVRRAGDALAHEFAAVGLEIEQRVAVAEADGAGERGAAVGVEQGRFEGIVRAAHLIIEADAGDGEAQVAVVLADDEHLVQAGLARGGFGEDGGTVADGDAALGFPARPRLQLGIGQGRIGGDLESHRRRGDLHAVEHRRPATVGAAAQAADQQGAQGRADGQAGRLRGIGRAVRSGLDLADELGHQGEFLGARQAAHAGLERGGHKVAAVGAMLDAEGMAVFVQEDGQHVHFACGFGIGFGDPFVGVAGGEEFRIVRGSGVDEPVVAGGVVVEGDGGAGGLSDGPAGEVGNVQSDLQCLRNSVRELGRQIKGVLRLNGVVAVEGDFPLSAVRAKLLVLRLRVVVGYTMKHFEEILHPYLLATHLDQESRAVRTKVVWYWQIHVTSILGITSHRF